LSAFQKLIIVAALDIAVKVIENNGGEISPQMQEHIDELLDRLFKVIQDEQQ
jgi:hypothetical protein